ncbi:AAA family ATPase [Myxococcota bacterium]|nr:AAA family ATPase [Myxococcota bacterium]
MSRLLQVTVENLGCFGTLRLQPGDSTLLLGANGAGKSTLLDVLFGLRELIAHGEDDLLGFPTWQLRPEPARVALDLATHQGAMRYELELDAVLRPGSAGPAWTVRSESLRLGERAVVDFRQGRFRGEDVGQDIPLSDDRSSLASVRFADDSPVSLFKSWLDRIWLLRLEPRRMEASAEEPDDGLAVSGENFVAWLLSFDRRKERLRRVVASLDGSVPGLEELVLERAGREQVLVARFAGGGPVDFDKLSDGQRCLIVLHAVIALAHRDCRLLLLDEPDAHVTPTEIVPLFSALREQVANRGTQVMVASHHPHVIDLLSTDQPWEFILRDGVASAEPFRVPLAQGVTASRHMVLRGRQ